MILEPADLERVFEDCFLDEYRTILIGGGQEPVYLPAADAESNQHRVIYREDFFASALHEVAHWCLAGSARRAQEDYGYWYSPDGRSEQEQTRFESVEVRPQALERIFSEVCQFPFNPSADNLTLGVQSSPRFTDAVEACRAQFLEKGLPARADRYRRALHELTESRCRSPRLREPSDTQRHPF
jgi:elongation factor P hydroxylase